MIYLATLSDGFTVPIEATERKWAVRTAVGMFRGRLVRLEFIG